MITAFMKVFTNLKNFKHTKVVLKVGLDRIMINKAFSFIRVQKKVKFLEDENFVEEK